MTKTLAAALLFLAALGIAEAGERRLFITGNAKRAIELNNAGFDHLSGAKWSQGETWLEIATDTDDRGRPDDVFTVKCIDEWAKRCARLPATAALVVNARFGRVRRPALQWEDNPMNVWVPIVTEILIEDPSAEGGFRPFRLPEEEVPMP